MTTRQSTPPRAAAYATACAWFPADQVTTPRARSSGVSAAIRLKTPRTLNEPVFWKSSAFRCAPSVSEEKVGVRWTRPAMVARARSTSSGVTKSSHHRDRSCYRDGQPHGERRQPARLARDLDRSAHRLRQLLHDRESEPG